MVRARGIYATRRAVSKFCDPIFLNSSEGSNLNQFYCI